MPQQSTSGLPPAERPPETKRPVDSALLRPRHGTSAAPAASAASAAPSASRHLVPRRGRGRGRHVRLGDPAGPVFVAIERCHLRRRPRPAGLIDVDKLRTADYEVFPGKPAAIHHVGGRTVLRHSGDLLEHVASWLPPRGRRV